MRPGQNKRMRGRNNNNNSTSNRRGPNPLTRSYESNGPDVKIRGTAHHVGEKYLQLARDAQSSGDPVMAESYLQHAEHYFRLIASAQLAQQQAQFGYQRQPGEQVEQDDDGDDDFDSLPDRFASPSEKVALQPPPQAQPPAQPYEPRNDRSYNDRQPYEARNNGQNGQAQSGQPPNGQVQNGHYADRPQQNDNRPRPPYADRQDRNGQQQDRGGHQDRNSQDRNAQDRGNQDRIGQERFPQGQDRSADRGNANGGERQSRDYDNRNFRNRRDERSRDGQPVRDFQPRLPVPDEQPVVGLPAFITAPTRAPVADVAEAEQPVIAQAQPPATGPETSEDAGFHMRPRRRRRPKTEFAGADGGSEGTAAPASGGESSEP